jgi:UPF0042 nucleotide-binding protein
MNFVIVTGMSGAGKSTVLKMFEDVGFYYADNLPPSLIPSFAELCIKREAGDGKVAIGIDIRGGKLFEDLNESLGQLDKMNMIYDILFLEAEDDVLITRYKETRRVHPLAKDGNITAGIDRERQLLSEVKQRATHTIDTSYLRTRQLKDKLVEIYVDGKHFNSLMVNIVSFGFKYGLPRESDLVFDVRFVTNPFYISSLKPLSGLDVLVKEFVFSNAVTTRFLKNLESMLHLLIPHYSSEGKNHLVISIGCTGGRHRSVAIAEELCNILGKSQYSVTVNHRDIDKDAAEVK